MKGVSPGIHKTTGDKFFTASVGKGGKQVLGRYETALEAALAIARYHKQKRAKDAQRKRRTIGKPQLEEQQAAMALGMLAGLVR